MFVQADVAVLQILSRIEQAPPSQQVMYIRDPVGAVLHTKFWRNSLRHLLQLTTGDTHPTTARYQVKRDSSPPRWREVEGLSAWLTD